MLIRLRSRFIATTSGTVIFFGGTVVVPPYAVWSLIRVLRPGRLRAGPGVTSIVPRPCTSHDSFQLADGRDEQEERGNDQRDDAPDHERRRRSERRHDRGEY